MKLKQRTSLATLLAILPFFSSANVWEEIKSMPATQYDVGRIFIEVSALEIEKRLQNERLEDTKYKLETVNSVTKNELGFKFSLRAKGKYIAQNDCSKFANAFQQNLINKGLVDGFWPSLNANLKNKLKQNLVVEVELINKDNGSIMTTCRS